MACGSTGLEGPRHSSRKAPPSRFRAVWEAWLLLVVEMAAVGRRAGESKKDRFVKRALRSFAARANKVPPASLPPPNRIDALRHPRVGGPPPLEPEGAAFAR